MSDEAKHIINIPANGNGNKLIYSLVLAALAMGGFNIVGNNGDRLAVEIEKLDQKIQQETGLLIATIDEKINGLDNKLQIEVNVIDKQNDRNIAIINELRAQINLLERQVAALEERSNPQGKK